ncbi:MotA/TolQ/ExbB proton channel family protein [Rhodovibrionaceae bacterium A322]
MSGLIKNALALVISVLAVQALYLGYIRPEADFLLKAAQESGESAPRDLVILLKDGEQEICLILMLWGAFLILGKIRAILQDNYLFKVDLLAHSSSPQESEEDPNSKSRKHGLKETLGLLSSLPDKMQQTPLVRTLMASIRRYLITSNVQDTSDAIESNVNVLSLKHDSENSMIRYVIWAIPSIGFIGTVRGIGEALAQANEALEGDITGMTESLGLAFNSTLVALLISIVLMLLFHQLQRLQDDQIIKTQDYCEDFLLNRISVEEEG